MWHPNVGNILRRKKWDSERGSDPPPMKNALEKVNEDKNEKKKYIEITGTWQSLYEALIVNINVYLLYCLKINGFLVILYLFFNW